MPLQKVKDFILHDLDEISEKIKEKIELIQNSNIEQNIDEKDCEKFAKRANKFLDICTDEEQKNTINEALQIIKSQTLSNQNLNKNNLSDFEKEIIRLMENGIKSDNLIDELAKNRNLREGSDRYDTLYDKVCDTLFDLEEKGILNHNLNTDYFTLKTENFNKRKMR